MTFQSGRIKFLVEISLVRQHVDDSGPRVLGILDHFLQQVTPWRERRRQKQRQELDHFLQQVTPRHERRTQKQSEDHFVPNR